MYDAAETNVNEVVFLASEGPLSSLFLADGVEELSATKSPGKFKQDPAKVTLLSP
jgi:hypothetical protein